jgi:hypothetical protein
VADLVANLQYLDPDSTVLLYDGSGGALLGELSRLTGPGVLVHPNPRAMAWGKLHGFALECMRFALERLDFAVSLRVRLGDDGGRTETTLVGGGYAQCRQQGEDHRIGDELEHKENGSGARLLEQPGCGHGESGN